MNKILVDIQEDEKIILLFVKYNVPYEVKKLEIGDYIIGNIVIERKSISDFINSMRGHLQEQIINMLMNKDEINQFVIALIGDYDDLYWDLYWQGIKLNQNSFYGMLASITTKYKVSIVHFKCNTQFIFYLKACLEKLDGVIDFTKIKKLDFKDNTNLSLLCSLPNISIKKAKKILEKYNIKLLLQNKDNNIVSVTELKNIGGIGKKIIDKVKPYFYIAK